MADESWRVPALVHELATGMEEPPSRYMVREQDRPGNLLLIADMPEPMPVIDLSKLPAADEVAKLRAALQFSGLFLATNHGIEASLMDASREFFRQPLEKKKEYSNLIEGKHWQMDGYENDQVITQDQILSWSDRLQLTVEPEDARKLAQWPKHPESFRDVLHEYTSKTRTIKDTILRAMAWVLELDENYFISQTGDKVSAFARFNYYPPCPRPDLVLGNTPHTDASVLTVLFVDNVVGSLQVQKDGTWNNVPSKPHTLLIILGDCMEIMNNGNFKSPVHRVVTNPEKERLSLAVFYFADGEKVLEPAAGLVDDNRPARYRKVMAKDYMVGLLEHYPKTGFIETLKLKN